MAMAAGIGATIDALPPGLPSHAALFGEDQARYLLALPEAEAGAVLAMAKAAGIPASRLGTTGGEALTLPGQKPISVAALRRAHEAWLPSYMAAPDAIVAA
jgi:phosphoribosylformylglycinamidine (FGAM) synthase-like enzyme